jgi:hypothetical protein
MFLFNLKVYAAFTPVTWTPRPWIIPIKDVWILNGEGREEARVLPDNECDYTLHLQTPRSWGGHLPVSESGLGPASVGYLVEWGAAKFSSWRVSAWSGASLVQSAKNSFTPPTHLKEPALYSTLHKARLASSAVM